MRAREVVSWSYSCALSTETASWPATSRTASSRSALKAALSSLFSSSSTARRVPRLRIGRTSIEQQSEPARGGARAKRAAGGAAGAGQGRVGGEAVVGGGGGDAQRLTGALDVAQGRQRHRGLVAGTDRRT